MKHFFYPLLIMVVSMMSAMSLVSCGSDDDDDAVSSKNKVGCVIYEFSQDELDLYNLKMTATGPNGESYGTYNFNTMTPAETDEKGVKTFQIDFPIQELPISLKCESSCSKNLADLNDEQAFVLIHSAAGGSFKEKGVGFSALKATVSRSITRQSGAGMKTARDNGIPFYEHYAQSTGSILSISIIR